MPIDLAKLSAGKVPLLNIFRGTSEEFLEEKVSPHKSKLLVLRHSHFSGFRAYGLSSFPKI